VRSRLCAGRVANGINTVHLSYVREKAGHALAGARQWIPAEDIKHPVKSLVTRLPPDLRFRAKGQLAMKTGELAFCYRYVPAGQRPLARLAKTYDQPAAVARMPGSMPGVVDPRAAAF
jgi:hypothetical protein